jgi:hypothetical protein
MCQLELFNEFRKGDKSYLVMLIAAIGCIIGGIQQCHKVSGISRLLYYHFSY